MEPTPYVQPARQRWRSHWKRSSENSRGSIDLHATPDAFWGPQASSHEQFAPTGAFCERLAAAEGCLGSRILDEMHRQHDMGTDFMTSTEEALTSPHSPCARRPSMAHRDDCLTDDPCMQPSLVRCATGDEEEQSACTHLQLPVATVFGSSPGNTPMPRRVGRSLGGAPEPLRKHGTPDTTPFTSFHFVSGVSTVQTCPGKLSYRLHRAAAKQHRAKAVRRTLDLRGAPGTVLQPRKGAGWRMRRPLVAGAKTSRAQSLPTQDLFQRNLRRAVVETPAPLFSLAEAAATLRPGETQGRRGLPPLAQTLGRRPNASLRKRSQEDEQQHEKRKMRAVQAPSQDVSSKRENKGNPPGDEKVQSARDCYMALSPSARMAALRLKG